MTSYPVEYGRHSVQTYSKGTSCHARAHGMKVGTQSVEPFGLVGRNVYWKKELIVKPAILVSFLDIVSDLGW